jgi:hypothetical protein|tara:strand:+ start:635 stop:898 length:264 start_codon:yes stop_codon:yes gene_type:complete
MIIDKIADAIRAIDNTRQCSHIVGDIDSITWLDGKAPISKADLEAKMAELETQKTNEANEKATDKASGNQKLLDLGLSQAEVNALTK